MALDGSPRRGAGTEWTVRAEAQQRPDTTRWWMVRPLFAPRHPRAVKMELDDSETVACVKGPQTEEFRLKVWRWTDRSPGRRQLPIGKVGWRRLA
jgi:hypothetical protein